MNDNPSERAPRLMLISMFKLLYHVKSATVTPERKILNGEKKKDQQYRVACIRNYC